MKKMIAGAIALVVAIASLVSCSGGNMGSPYTDNETIMTQPNVDVTDTSQVNETSADPSNETDNPTVNIPDVPSKKTVKFVAAGDVIIHAAIFREAEKIASTMPSYAGNYYFSGMYENVASLIKGADVAYVNHEAPIAKTAISGYPNFNAPDESGDALIDLGFNVINIANNHMFDVEHRTEGYRQTIEYWANKPVLQIGGYTSQSDFDTPRILNIEGMKIAFLAYTYGTNGCYMNQSTASAGYVTPLIDDSAITRQIAAARAAGDFVIVSVHWGEENTFNPTSEQKRVAKLIADNGADVIIGMHSHTVQPIEWINGNGGKKTLCVYSLGNFISGMLSSKNMVGGIMTFSIVSDQNGTYVEDPLFVPTVCHYDIADFSQKDVDGNPVRTGFKVYLMENYTDALAKAHGVQNYGSFGLETLKGYVKNTVSSEFLPGYLK